MTTAELYKKAASLPLQPGCYIMRDAGRNIIYIGKAKRLRLRVQSYFRTGAPHEPKVAKMVSQVFDFEVIVTDSEFEALVLECSLIKQHKPKYNILLKDDKGFSYICISHEEYPRLSVALQKADDGAEYIGPYMGSFALKQLVEAANLAFGLPSCSRRFPQDFGRGRPCLNAHIGRCMALCTGRISREDYLADLQKAVTLVTKGSKELLAGLEREMQTASEHLDFERAARLRDTIAAIQKVESGQKVVKSDGDLEQDVFAFAANERSVCAVVLKFRDGKLCDKDEQVIGDTTSLDEAREEFVSHYYIQGNDIPKKILLDEAFETQDLVQRLLTEQRGRTVTIARPQRGENHALVAMAYNNAVDRLKREAGRKNREEAALGELANLLGLAEPPRYIEAYDISNYGDEAVAGLVVFCNGVPRRGDYKRFIIKEVSGIDDYAAMVEAITRRVRRFEEGKSKEFARKPDIILLDGGRGHLSVVASALAGTAFADLPVFGMVKDNKHRTRGIVAPGGELGVAMHRSAFALISKIQDETHRFTVEYQRGRHSRVAFRSSLLDIAGIGESRAKAMLKHFKTITAIKQALPDELAAVEGMGRNAAQAVYRHFHPDVEE